MRAAGARASRPFSAHRVLRPFLEAYRVVADALLRRDPAQPVEEEPFLREALALGKQYELQRRIQSGSRSRRCCSRPRSSWRGTAGSATRARPTSPSAGARSPHEMREVIRRVDGVQALVRARQAGVQI